MSERQMPMLVSPRRYDRAIAPDQFWSPTKKVDTSPPAPLLLNLHWLAPVWTLYATSIREGKQMAAFLVVLAVLAGLIGSVLLSQATLGVGIIGGACLLGILARICQADKDNRLLREEIAELRSFVSQQPR